MQSPHALYHLDPHFFDQIYGPTERRTLSSLLTTDGQLWTADQIASRAEALSHIEVLLAGWGCAPLDVRFLDRLPRLRAVFYAGGSVKSLLGDGVLLERGILLSTANRELAESVGEFLFGVIVLSSRHIWRNMGEMRRNPVHPRRSYGPGNYRTTIGLIGYGAIGRVVRRHLRVLQVRVLVSDPRLEEDEARSHGIERAGLDQIFSECDVVSCHLPNLPSTADSLGAEHFQRMKPGATFVNTARGAVVRENELALVLADRPDLWAVLDVLAETPAGAPRPIFSLPNVTLTPHIAGCLGAECRRLGNFVVDEVRRWRSGQPLIGAVTPDLLPFSA